MARYLYAVASQAITGESTQARLVVDTEHPSGEAKVIARCDTTSSPNDAQAIVDALNAADQPAP